MFLGEKLPNEMKKKLINIAFQKPVMYMTLTPTLTSCGDCGKQMV